MTDFLPIKSSNLDGAKYDPATQTVTVKFKGGGTYEYAGVPAETFGKFAATFETDDSSGKFLHSHIKKYPAKRVDVK